MAKFSERSKRTLSTVHPDLQTLFNYVIKEWDCTVVSGLRTDEEQQALYAKGRTEDGEIVTHKDGVVNKSKHQLGLAVDVVPYPSMYSDVEIMDKFGLYVLDVAMNLKESGLIDSRIVWGGTWNWKDRPHFQI